MRLTIAYSKFKKRNLVLINNVTHQRETLSERPIRLPLRAWMTVVKLLSIFSCKILYLSHKLQLVEQHLTHCSSAKINTHEDPTPTTAVATTQACAEEYIATNQQTKKLSWSRSKSTNKRNTKRNVIKQNKKTKTKTKTKTKKPATKQQQQASIDKTWCLCKNLTHLSKEQNYIIVLDKSYLIFICFTSLMLQIVCDNIITCLHSCFFILLGITRVLSQH